MDTYHVQLLTSIMLTYRYNEAQTGLGVVENADHHRDLDFIRHLLKRGQIFTQTVLKVRLLGEQSERLSGHLVTVKLTVQPI